MFIKFCFLVWFYLFVQLMGICFSEDVLNQIEYQKYGTTFQNESLAERLSKLETDYFGMEQKGSIDERLDLIYRIANNSRTTAVHKSIYNSPVKKKSAIRNFLDNLSDIGTMTGFTPSFTSSTFDDGSYYETTGRNSSSYFHNRRLLEFDDNRNHYCPHYNHNNYHSHTRNFYIPPNVQSRSSVNIIRD